MATFYADNQRGNDANPGTKALPKLTAAAALALAVTAGDVVSLMGVQPYREVLTPTHSGFGSGLSQAATDIQKILGTYRYDRHNIPITITSTDPENPAELTCFRIVTAWGAIDGNGNYKTTATHRNPMFVRINGVQAKHGASLTTLAPGEWFFENVGSYMGYVYVNVNPAANVIEIPDNRTALEATGINALVIDNIKYTGNRESSTAGMRFINCSNILVQNVDFSGCWKALDFRGTSDNCIAAFNRVTYCGDGIDANADSTNRPTNILFYGNYCEGLYKDRSSVSWLANAITTGTVNVDHEGIAWTNVGDNIHAVKNTVKWWYDNISCYSGTVGVANWHILQNLILESRDDGIQASAAASMSIADLHVIGNLIVRCGLHDNTADRVNNWATAIPSSVQYVEFCNNTLIQNANGYLCSAVAGKDHNNIYYDHAAAGGTAYHSNYNGAASMTNHSIDNNRYYLAGGWRKSAGTYRNSTQFALWKSDTSKDVLSLQTNPNLDADYRPTDSVCIGAGLKWWVNKPRPVDFNGSALPDIAIDIGAMQSKSHPFHPKNLPH